MKYTQRDLANAKLNIWIQEQKEEENA
ncbi:hypothetical protein Aes508_154 [Aeromonas phage Aes508]|uniref:Uncharacterized protein n=1 Tax=Aeromonas phage Aes508 TaxID=1198013 RepID=J7KKK8_9CAUD|nr:hypothetical protein F484_gp153 [Aeromonas phage Aes508]AFQ97236.1 hypothetical protein Aes508_154 [Aeromonas phage Aes508]